MEKVNINRGKLHVIVLQNREAHLKEYKEAYEGYCTKLAQELSDLLPKVIAQEEFQLPSLIPPQCHKKEYDKVVRMLELSEDEVVSLEDYEFQKYVLDEWDWTRNFKFANSVYSSKR